MTEKQADILIEEVRTIGIALFAILGALPESNLKKHAIECLQVMQKKIDKMEDEG